jgi:hypothetical protein
MGYYLASNLFNPFDFFDMKVIVYYAPVSERYWYEGCEATVSGNQIRLCGCWFDLDNRFNIVPCLSFAEK